MIDFAADPNAPYDPDPLPVGTRVRVRLSGECSWEVCQRADWSRQVNGRLGVIAHRAPGCIPPGHDYTVRWLQPFPIQSRWFGVLLSAVGYFARAELERLS